MAGGGSGKESVREEEGKIPVRGPQALGDDGGVMEGGRGRHPVGKRTSASGGRVCSGCCHWQGQ